MTVRSDAHAPLAAQRPTINQGLRAIAGAFIMLSVALGLLVSPWFLAFTAFVGLNLFQSAFTNWCPMMAVLRKAGFRYDG